MEIDGVAVSLIFLIVVALAFDFLNGLHDAANSIATIVSTRVLKPHHAVMWAAFFNFIAFFFFGVAVAKTVGSGIISPALIDDAVIFGVSWSFVRATPAFADGTFRKLQFVSAALYSLGHGGNDAQKTMGIIAALLYAHGMIEGEFYVPLWVAILCYAAMALGTLFGGWRIVHTMGSKITRLTPMQGFCAETAGAATLFGATYLGIPVSTTHTITGAIIGVGAARRTSAVRWGIARGIVFAWIVTIPASALIAAVSYWLVSFIL